MSGSEGETAEGCLESIVLCDPGAGINRRLVVRPKGFFSREFEMVVENDEGASAPSLSSRLARMFSMNLVAFALLIGVPILLYSAA